MAEKLIFDVRMLEITPSPSEADLFLPICHYFQPFSYCGLSEVVQYLIRESDQRNAEHDVCLASGTKPTQCCGERVPPQWL